MQSRRINTGRYWAPDVRCILPQWGWLWWSALSNSDSTTCHSYLELPPVKDCSTGPRQIGWVHCTNCKWLGHEIPLSDVLRIVNQIGMQQGKFHGTFLLSITVLQTRRPPSLLLERYSLCVVCQVIPRGPSSSGAPLFARQPLLLKQHLDVVLDSIPQAFCWTHQSFSQPRKDFCLPDGVHVNPAGQYHLYWSYRGAILHAFHILTARTI